MKKIFLTLTLGLALLLPMFTASSCSKPDNIAKVIIWQGQVNAASWSAFSVTSLTTYVNGELMASQAAGIYFNSTPSCSSNGGMKFDINLKKNTTGKINVIVKGDDDFEYYNEQMDIKSTECNQLELQ
jgi:hypothetical protein